MNFTKKILPSTLPGTKIRSPAVQAVCRTLLYAVAAGLLAAVAAAPAVAPYHGRFRAIFVTLLPFSAGYLIGALDHAFTRRHARVILAAAGIVLLAAVSPSLRTDAPRVGVALALMGGVAVALALARIGMLQAGIGWRGHEGNTPEDYAPGWAGALALAIAWSWLFISLLNPRENFPPTRWLLTATGAPPSAVARQDSRIRLLRVNLTAARFTPERGLVMDGDYQFRVGPLTAGPGSLQVAVSVRRADGKAFGRPAWLTLDVDDPKNPDLENDAYFYDVHTLPDQDPLARAARQAAESPNVTAYAWYGLTQSLPGVRIRARLWTLDTHKDGDLAFRPVAEADLGAWNLTILRKLRPRA